MNHTEGEFRQVLDGARQHGIVLMDTKGCVQTWNLGAENITGYTEAEVLGTKLRFLFLEEEDSQAALEHELAESSELGQMNDSRWLRRKNGTRFFTTCYITALKEPSGEVFGFAKIFDDSTERKLAADAVFNQQKWLESLLELLPVPVVLFDQGSITPEFVNRAASEQAIDFPLDLSDYPDETYFLSDSSGQKISRERWPRQRLARGESLYGEQYVWHTPKGEVPLLIYAQALPSAFGHPEKGVIVFQELRKLKETERQLNQQKQKAEAANAAKTTFLANMSHEIRTPLGIILGFVELLREKRCSPEEHSRFLEVIESQSQHLLRLVSDILDISKIEADRLDVESIPTDVVRLVDDVISELSLAANKKKIQLITRLPRGIPGRVITDPTRLRQILVNLLGNAIKFTEKGQVVLKVELEHLADEALQINFFIRDTGVGMSRDVQDRLFTAFVQADSSITRKHGGTGLGLTLSRKLAQALGGDMKVVESSQGVGTEFEAWIKVLQNENSKVGANGSPLEAECSEKSLENKHILLAEDSVENQFLVNRYLTAVGVKVDTVENGLRALEEARRHHYDLILMDIQMPIMDGYTAVEKLREEGFSGPILALTANALPEERERSLRAGCNEYLTKPVGRKKLVERVRYFLDPASQSLTSQPFDNTCHQVPT